MQPKIPQLDEPPYFWRQGEHVAACGDTGSGKSYLTRELDYMREFVVRFKTKSDSIRMPGFRRAKHARVMDDQSASRILLAPEYSYHAREGWEMLERAYRQGGWTIDIDELWLAHRIGLKDQIERGLTQFRSLKATMIIGMQRPVDITRFALSQATHLFSFRLDGRDAKTFAEATTPRVLPLFDTLPKYHFVYYNRATRYVGTGTADELGAIFTNPQRDRPTLSDAREREPAAPSVPSWLRRPSA